MLSASKCKTSLKRPLHFELAGGCDGCLDQVGERATRRGIRGQQLRQRLNCRVFVYGQDRPLQTWKTFLRNHVEGIASIDLFVVPTIAFEQLFVFLVLGQRRRRLLWTAVTRKPTTEWLARQITEAFLGTALQNISFATMTEHLALRSRLSCER